MKDVTKIKIGPYTSLFFMIFNKGSNGFVGISKMTELNIFFNLNPLYSRPLAYPNYAFMSFLKYEKLAGNLVHWTKNGDDEIYRDQGYSKLNF